MKIKMVIERKTIIKIIAFILVFFTMLITLPIKRYYNSSISITKTNDIKSIKYGNNISISFCDDKNLSIFNSYKKDIINNGELDFYGYDVIYGKLGENFIYCVKDNFKSKSIIMIYKDKHLLKKAVLELIDKNILTLTEYQYYRLNRFLFGYKRPEFSIIGTVTNIDR